MEITRHEMQELRVEQKFLIREDQATVVAARVRDQLALDLHSAGHPDRSYDVHSVYLDSDALQSYWSTVHRQRNRFKLRVRFYNDDSTQPAYVEIKGKADGQTVKQRCSVPRDYLKDMLSEPVLTPASRLGLSRDLTPLEAFLQKARALKARPKLHVAYRREAYVSRKDNAVRVTFDRDVRAEPVAGLRLTSEMLSPRSLCERDVVIEVKCNGNIPRWLLRLIRQLDQGKCHFTKYVTGIEQHGLNVTSSEPDAGDYAWRSSTPIGRQ